MPKNKVLLFSIIFLSMLALIGLQSGIFSLWYNGISLFAGNTTD